MTATPNESQPTEPGTQPAPSAAGTTEGLDPKIGGLLSYLLFGWIGGLIMFLTQKHPEVRFHGAQSILTSIAFLAVYLGLGVLGVVFGLVPGLGFIGGILSFLLSAIVGIGGLVLWIILCIKGYNLEHFKLPLVGDMAESWSGSNPGQPQA